MGFTVRLCTLFRKKRGSRVHYGLVVALGLGPNHLFVWAGKHVLGWVSIALWLNGPCEVK
jgi:hypothetical protein